MPVHVYPIHDERAHELSTHCWCDPEVRWIDPETGTTYVTPMVVHAAADCREIVEQAMRSNGERGVSDVGKQWRREETET